MSDKLSPEQIAAITQAVEEHLKATGQNVNAQQIPNLFGVLNQLPNVVTSLITGSAGAGVNIITSLLNVLTGSLTNIAGTIAGSNLAPQLVNIIQKQIPTQTPTGQPEQQ